MFLISLEKCLSENTKFSDKYFSIFRLWWNSDWKNLWNFPQNIFDEFFNSKIWNMSCWRRLKQETKIKSISKTSKNPQNFFFNSSIFIFVNFFHFKFFFLFPPITQQKNFASMKINNPQNTIYEKIIDKSRASTSSPADAFIHEKFLRQSINKQILSWKWYLYLLLI